MTTMKNTMRVAARVAALATLTSFVTLLPGAAQAATADCSVTQPIATTAVTDSSMDTDAPDRIHIGDPATTVGLTSNSEVGASALGLAYDFLGARAVSGYSDLKVLMGTNEYPVRVVFPKAPIVKGSSLDVVAVGSFVLPTPTAPAVVTLRTGMNHSAVTQFYKNVNGTTPDSSTTASCTVRAGQDTTFHTMAVVARSTTALTLNNTTIQQGTDVSTATANVTVNGGSVAGSVVFAIDGTDRPAVAVSGGKATLSLPNDLSVGNHAVTARFVPTDAVLYETSTSPAQTLTVTAPATQTSTSLALTPNPAPANTPVQATATISPTGAAGQVQFQVDGATVETAPVSGGTASVNLPGQPQGEYVVKAKFVPANSRNFAPSESAGQTLLVARSATATSATLTLSRTTAAATDLVRATSVVTPSNAAGRVEFRSGGTVLGEGTLSGGRVQNATLDVTGLAPGQHPVVAHFLPSAPASFAASQSAPVTLTITPPASPTTTALTLSAATAAATADVTATATVAPVDATGEVEFSVDGRSVTAPVSNGTASAVLPKVAAGTHQVTARYLPSGSVYASSVSQAVNLVVTEVATSTALTLSSTAGVSGDIVRATADVTPASAQGTVTFRVDGNTVTGTVANGTVTVDLPALPVGTHEVTASFASQPSGVFAASQAAPVALTMAQPVQARATTTTLDVASTTIAKGDQVPVQATVTSEGAAPIGSVVFTAGAQQVSVPLDNGSAQGTLSGLEIGDHDVTARFVPTQPQVFAPSVSAPVRVRVVRPAAITHTTVQLTPSEATVGQTVRATASVSSDNGAPNGHVRFTLGEVSELIAVVDRVAVWNLVAPPVGAHTVRAEFVPSQPVEQRGSTATATLQTSAPNPVRTVTGLVLSTDRVTVGESATASANVSATAGTAAGRVIFTIDGEDIAADLTNGRASVVLPDTLGEGVYEVTARFVPGVGTGFGPSSAAPRTLVVQSAADSAAATQTLVSLPSSQVAEGTGAVVNVAVVSAAGVPDGSVQVLLDGVGRRTATLVAGGATVTLPADVLRGQHSVSARFVPDDETAYAPSSSAQRSLVVTAPGDVQTLTTLTLAPSTVEVGEVARATARVQAASGAVSGSVEFTVDGRVLAATLQDGIAAVDLPGDLAQGSYAIDAMFTPAGDVHAGSATSAVLTVRDSAAEAKATTTTLSLSRASAVAGELVSATVTATAVGATPTGEVRVSVAGTVLSAPLVGGVAMVSLPPLAAGTYAVQAALVGGDGFLPSSAAAASLTITPGATAVTRTTTALSVDATSLRAGQAVAVSATVSPASSGQVRFSAGWRAVTVPVVNGVARASLPAMAAGQATVSATFIPVDSTTVGASWDSATVTVAKAASSVKVTGRHSAKAKTLALKATVTTLAPGGTCDTRAQFVVKVGPKAVRKVLVPVTCTGVATRNITVPTAKAYTVVVKFKGNKQVAASTVTKVFRAKR